MTVQKVIKSQDVEAYEQSDLPFLSSYVTRAMSEGKACLRRDRMPGYGHVNAKYNLQNH